MSVWQKCPVCGGSGKKPYSELKMNEAPTDCNVCNGRGIISELTGEPPKKVEQEKDKNDGDDRKTLND